MKNYFGFTLTGTKLLPIWLTFYLAFITPYVFLIVHLKNAEPGARPSGMIFLYFFILILAALLLTYFMVKIIIDNFQYKDIPILFNGKFENFAPFALGGLVLCVITLGIYMAWFIRDMHRFFVNNSTFENEPLKFRGKGGQLFLILLLTIFLPTIILTITMTTLFLSNPGNVPTMYTVIQQIITWIIMIPYMYFFYKWMVNIDYKTYSIHWETDFWNSCGKIALEMFLCIITIGIYFPMATIKLYAYFTEKTIAQSGDVTRRFGFDKDNFNDFLMIWGQTLLTIITLGLYYPWAISKIGSRILSRTYLE